MTVSSFIPPSLPIRQTHLPGLRVGRVGCDSAELTEKRCRRQTAVSIKEQGKVCVFVSVCAGESKRLPERNNMHTE